MNTGMDDQLARCKVAEKEGWGIVHSSNSLSDSINELLSFSRTENIQSSENGSDLFARSLLN